MARDMSCPVCWESKKPSSSRCRWAYIPLRRSYSTPSETRPAMRRRATVSVSRRRPAAATAMPTITSPWRSPCLTWSIARPVSQGMATVPPIAAAASESDQKTPRR